MTSMGLAILDSFTKFLNTKYSKYSDRKRVLSSREIYLLKRSYNWEEMEFASEAEIAEELQISSERVRQLRKRAFHHLRVIAGIGNSPIAKSVNSIFDYSLKEERYQIHKTIVRLWLNELPEFPALPIIRLLAELCNDNVQSACQYLASWKKAKSQELFRNLISQRKKLRNQAILKDQLSQNIIWFDKVGRWKKEAFYGREPKRIVNRKEQYLSGEIYSSKCQRPIQHESGVELEFIKKLETNPSVLIYLEQPVTILYNRNETDYEYTPDFAILLDDGRCFIAEVKYSYAEMLDARVHRRMEALIEFCEKHGFGLLLTNGRYSLNYLSNYPCTPGLEKAFQDRLRERGGRTIFHNECRELLLSYRAKKVELLSLVLKNNWGFYPYPFKLTPRSPYTVFREKIVNRLLGLVG